MGLPFEITILGNNSAIPAHGRHPSAQLLNIHHHLLLVDCGEGTQIRFAEQKAKAFKVEHIFITHLHGDHFYGLIGLLSSMGLLGRIKPLNIYAHPPLKGLIEALLAVSNAQLGYEVRYHHLPETGSSVLLETRDFVVKCFQLEHRIPCCGFHFEERFPKQKINAEKLEKEGISKLLWGAIQRGEDLTLENGKEIISKEYILDGPKPRSYAYCTDTRFTTSFIENILGTDTIYVDSTYLTADSEKATQRYHCTSAQAAEIAKKANVGRLLLGHFSSKYRDLNPLLEEARAIFPNTELGEEGKVFEIELW